MRCVEREKRGRQQTDEGISSLDLISGKENSEKPALSCLLCADSIGVNGQLMELDKAAMLREQLPRDDPAATQSAFAVN